MGKKKAQSSNLGKSIIRSRFGKNVNKNGESFLHTSELGDGYDWGRLNLQSVTEQSNLDDFLATAELAGTEFTAEKLNVTFVDPIKTSGVLSKDELRDVAEAQEKHRQLLRIPRRPPWDSSTSADELESLERATFLDWRRNLAELQEVENIHLTPYEKNLDFWRQLWRVIERSDVVVQIVDARNPVLFRCADLERYVKEVSPDKVNLVLVNKADYLTDTQRELWSEYFQKEGVLVAFWSALEESKKQEQKESVDEMEENLEDSEMDSDDDSFDDQRGDNSVDFSENVQSSLPLVENLGNDSTQSHAPATQESNNQMNPVEMCDSVDSKTNFCARSEQTELRCENPQTKCETSKLVNCSRILTGEELLELFRSVHKSRKVNAKYTTIGMVGYPNVGKSSTINAILKMKKVPVSATPGRTKHFQTLFVDSDLMLCDCPGLVFPSFVTTKAELVVNGVLPIDQMRDHVPPVSLICQRIPRPVLESVYGINIPVPGECEDPDRPPTAPELLNAHGYMRGFMTSRGQPDNPRSSRYLLKDYVNGKLLFCHPPPGVESEIFHPITGTTEDMDVLPSNQTEYTLQVEDPVVPESKMDKDFFRHNVPKLHSKGVRGVPEWSRSTGQHVTSASGEGGGSTSSLAGKPWKKHNNRNKKEKSRRIHGYLNE